MSSASEQGPVDSGYGAQVKMLVEAMTQGVWNFATGPEQVTDDGQATRNNQQFCSSLITMVRRECEHNDLRVFAVEVFSQLLIQIVAEFVPIVDVGTPAIRLADIVSYLTHDSIEDPHLLGVRAIPRNNFNYIVKWATQHHPNRPDTGSGERFKRLNIWLISLWNFAYPPVSRRIFTRLDPLEVAVEFYLQWYEVDAVWSVIN